MIGVGTRQDPDENRHGASAAAETLPWPLCLIRDGDPAVRRTRVRSRVPREVLRELLLTLLDGPPGGVYVGWTPQPRSPLSVHGPHPTSGVYHKEGRALRTETTINDTRDFHLGKRLTHLPALREIGFHANRRLLRVQRLSHDPITGADALHRHHRPRHHSRRYPRLRLLAVSPTSAAIPCSPHCWSSGCTRTASPTRTCAPSPASCADSIRTRCPPGR